VAYSSARSGSTEVWVTASNGSGQPRRLTDLGAQAHVDLWSPDGRTLSLHHHGKGGAVNILLPRVDGVEQKPQVLLEREIAVGARFSRDGHYVAYDSAQTGQWEVYIRSYPERSSQMTVSVGGGTEPVWAQNGDIFYRSLTRERMFAVGYDGAQTESRNTGATISSVLLRLPIRFPYPAIRCLG
jgi:eukaryotic-like serine/threonine-protein kinase